MTVATLNIIFLIMVLAIAIPLLFIVVVFSIYECKPIDKMEWLNDVYDFLVEIVWNIF